MLGDYSLPDVLERLQQALEASIMELTLLVEEQGARKVDGNVRGALEKLLENASHIKQGLARLKKLDIGYPIATNSLYRVRLDAQISKECEFFV